MTTYEIINPQEGFELTIEHATRLFASAELIAKQGQYTTAIALMVIAAEEAMKAVVIFSYQLFPKQDRKYIDQTFEKHKFKLEQIQASVALLTLLNVMLEFVFDEVAKNKTGSVEEILKGRKIGLQKAVKWIESETGSKKSQLSQELEWWKHAKSLKEQCLYVSTSNGRFHSPSQIKVSQFKKTKSYVSKFIGQVKAMQEFDLDNETTKSFISKIIDRMI